MTDKKLTKKEKAALALKEGARLYAEEVVELYEGDYGAIKVVINGHLRMEQSVDFFRAAKIQIKMIQERDVMSRMSSSMKQRINKELVTWGGVVLQLDEEGNIVLVNVSNLEFKHDGTVVAHKDFNE